MAYTITNRCIKCDSCVPQCPKGAIKIEGDDFWIDPSLCDDCRDYTHPVCVITCPTNSPIPRQAKKGRCKIDDRPIASSDLFANGESNPFASAIVVWELCNVLSQRQALPWQTDNRGTLCYHRQINQGRGSITLRIAESANPESAEYLKGDAALEAIKSFDIRAACLNLIFAAHATALEKSWEQEFVINDRQIEDYLGLDKRRDLSKTNRLILIKELVQQPCRLQASITWYQQGKVKGFSIESDRLWQLVDVQHHFQEDDQGCKHLSGLTFRIKAGLWASYFLNKQGCKERSAFYQYGSLPKPLLSTVTSIWQQHEGAVRIMLWLLFKTKMGREQRVTVPTLMRVAYGEQRMLYAASHRDDRKRLLKTFESDLEALNHYGLKPAFDPVTYPVDIQPLWAKLSDIPEDAEEALEFWTNDGQSDRRLTDSGPRGKWNRLMNARILCFELPPEWEQTAACSIKKKEQASKQYQKKTKNHAQPVLSGEQIIKAREKLSLSQRELAGLIGKSQSWIRDVERGRFRVKPQDQILLQRVLGKQNS